MKIGFSLGGVHPRSYLAIARRADELGYESIWVPEHLVFPATIRSPHPYAGPGAPPFNPDTPAFDPFVLLGHLAAVTSRVQLCTGVYILPLRNPFVTARAAVTVDMLSGGRLILGVGIGWLKEEFEIVGESWSNRAARSREIVEVLRRLWSEETIEHRGQHYSFPAARFRPKPSRPGGIPIHFGGITPPALRRAAALGDGWVGVRHGLDETRAIVARLTELRRAAGRQDAPFEVTVGPDQPVTPDVVARYRDAGASRLTVTPWTRPSQGRLTEQLILEGLGRFAEAVVTKV